MKQYADYLKLAVETLEASRMHARKDSCFVSNIAANELKQCGTDAMEAIERVVAEKVAVESEDFNQLQVKYRGLHHLLLNYFITARGGQANRAANFLRSLRGPLLELAILAIRPQPHIDQPYPQVPESLMLVLREIANGERGPEKERAVWVLDYVATKLPNESARIERILSKTGKK